MAPTLGGAALWYCEQGFLVLPLKEGMKVPATQHGLKDASMAPDTIRAWWTKNPNYNIGLLTGHFHDVIDVDGPDGIKSIAEIEDAGNLPDIIGIVTTPRGFHICIRPTGDGNATGLLPGIDYRGTMGYVVAPPSIVNGVPYQWTQPIVIEADGLRPTRNGSGTK